jgi:V/A-type H+-transporting ATPase subunit C
LTKTKPEVFLFLSAMLRSRETRLLSPERIERMLDAAVYDDAAKQLLDCGYPDMSGMNAAGIESVLSSRRAAAFAEIGGNSTFAKRITDVFRMKYDYHNIKVLVKSMGANVDATRLLSDSGRVPAPVAAEAFISGERGDLPGSMGAVMGAAVGILSRTSNPQLADIAVDKAYYAEFLAEAAGAGGAFFEGYARLLIDSANLRIYTRAARIGRDAGFLANALIEGGRADTGGIVRAFPSPEELGAVFSDPLLKKAAALAREAISGGEQTRFELECDNAAMYYFDPVRYVAFGPTVIIGYLAEMEWEITAVRMILTGKLSGIAPEVIRERLRENFV